MMATIADILNMEASVPCPCLPFSSCANAGIMYRTCGVPQSVAGAGAGGSSGRGRGGRRGGAGSGGGGGGVDAEEMMELLGGPQASQDAAAALVAALRQQQAGGQQQGGRARGRRSAGGAGGSGGGGGGRPDMWRLCSIVQAVHLIVWNAVGYTGELGGRCCGWPGGAIVDLGHGWAFAGVRVRGAVRAMAGAVSDGAAKCGLT